MYLTLYISSPFPLKPEGFKNTPTLFLDNLHTCAVELIDKCNIALIIVYVVLFICMAVIVYEDIRTLHTLLLERFSIITVDVLYKRIEKYINVK